MQSAFCTISFCLVTSVKANSLACGSTEVRKMRWVAFIKNFNFIFKFSATYNLLIIHKILNRGKIFN